MVDVKVSSLVAMKVVSRVEHSGHCLAVGLVDWKVKNLVERMDSHSVEHWVVLKEMQMVAVMVAH